MLRLITSGALRSDFTVNDGFLLVLVILHVLALVVVVVVVVRGLRPWKEMLEGESFWCFCIVGVMVNKAEEEVAIFSDGVET